MSLSEDQDVFYDAESGDEKGTEISSPESQQTKEENGQSCTAWGMAKVVTGALGVALYYAAPYIPTVLNGIVASSIDNGGLNGINGTCPRNY